MNALLTPSSGLAAHVVGLCPTLRKLRILRHMTYDVTLTELASTGTCHQRVHTTAAGIASAVGRGLQDLYEFAARAAVTPAGPPQLSFPDPAPGRELDLDLCLPISGRPEKSGDIDVVVLPEGPVALTFHHGR
ncbi:hypothetical protein GCM10022267_10070 [Lentzea roselyniae]|uniref:Uncharacterized protein n=2 Tax=Lentzea roselyniae TaxID=531940 RepID=A0ABP7A6H6_9PSEU